MNWYLIVKFFHIAAVATTIGGMFARQLVREHGKKSPNVELVVSLTQVARRHLFGLSASVSVWVAVS